MCRALDTVTYPRQDVQESLGQFVLVRVSLNDREPEARSLIKRYRTAVGSQDADSAAETFAAAERAIRKAATKGIIPKKRADRQISRLAKSLNTLAAK